MKKHISELLELMHSDMNPEKIAGSMRFFKTGKGEYGEGDVFWGLTVPRQQYYVKKYYKLLKLEDIRELTQHEVHEVRLTALMILVTKYKHAESKLEKEAIVKLYSSLFIHINNWDLVDCSAHQILGDWYLDSDKKPLLKMAQSSHLWTVRIAVIATYAFIRKENYLPTLQMAEMLLDHKHDLIHKAVGWMLREIGNRDFQIEYNWLTLHYQKMPRTMLRYAIEKFDEQMRQDFLKGRISPQS